MIRGDSPTSSAWQARQGGSRDHYFLVAPCKGIGIPESGKFSLVESGVLGFGIRDTGQGIRNPTNDWNPEPSSIDEGLNPVPGIRNTRREILNPRMSWTDRVVKSWVKITKG